MPIIERSITIAAPVEDVFAVVDDAKRQTEYLPGVTKVADVVRTQDRVGDTYKSTYSILGMRFPTKVSIIEWQQNKTYVEKMEGSLPGTFAVHLEPDGQGTKVSYTIDYTITMGVLGKVMNRLLFERMNEKTVEGGLENLKILCELGGAERTA
jgi:carbon monoxide dehydrogenase subunit G